LYKPLLEAAGVELPAMSDRCPTHAGQYYSTMTDHEEKWSTWIWNPNLAQPLTFDLPSNTWVEIIHQGYKLDGDAAWLYYTPGTAIWINLGTTQAYLDHGDATLALLNEQCESGGTGPENLPNECIPQFPRLYKAAIAQGLDTLQFLKHADMICGEDQDPHNRRNMAIEIVDLGGPGTTACAQESSGVNRYRAGWDAASPCDCDNDWDADHTVNCAGFGMRSGTPPSPPSPPSPTMDGQIVWEHDHRWCIDISSCHHLEINHCDSHASTQRWQVDTASQTLRTGDGSHCVVTDWDLGHLTPEDGLRLKLEPCSEHSERWVYNSEGRLQNEQWKMCIFLPHRCHGPQSGQQLGANPSKCSSKDSEGGWKIHPLAMAESMEEVVV